MSHSYVEFEGQVRKLCNLWSLIPVQITTGWAGAVFVQTNVHCASTQANFNVQIFILQDTLLCILVYKCQHFTGPYCIVLRAGIAQSVQRIATRWTVRGSNPGGSRIFRTRPDRLWGPPSLLYSRYRVFPGGKAAGAWR